MADQLHGDRPEPQPPVLVYKVDVRILDCSVLASEPRGVLTTSPRIQRHKPLRLIKVMQLQAVASGNMILAQYHHTYRLQCHLHRE